MLAALTPGHLPATVVGELLAQVQVAAQPNAGLARVPGRVLAARRRPPVGEQLLEGERGGVVGGRDVDDNQASRLTCTALIGSMYGTTPGVPGKIPPQWCLHPTEWQAVRSRRRLSPAAQT